MTKDEMIELAKQAGWQYAHGESGYEALWAFGKLVAEKEYERGFIDGMQKQMQSSVDKAVNAMGKREWVGLTDEEKAQFVVAYYPSNWDRKTAVSLMNDYEKYLKEKNT